MTASDGKAVATRLASAARAAIEGGLERTAARAATEIAAGAPEAAIRIERHAGAATVTLSGPGVFAREFGALDSTSDPVVAPALRRMKRRPA